MQLQLYRSQTLYKTFSFLTANITTVAVATATANNTIELYIFRLYSAIGVKFSFRLRSCKSTEFNFKKKCPFESKPVLSEIRNKVLIRFTNAFAVIHISDQF